MLVVHRVVIETPLYGPLDVGTRTMSTEAILEANGSRRSPASSFVDRHLMMDKRRLVSIVDDDESIRESLPDLLRQFGYATQAFASAEAFLSSDAVSHTACLLLDVAMPGMSGPDLQQELKRRRVTAPIIFITAQGDSQIRSQLLAQGAADLLSKPFSENELMQALDSALRTRS